MSRFDVAAWYLDKVAAARPDDWRVHAHRAEAFEGLGRPGDAAAEHDRATSLGAEPAYLVERAINCLIIGNRAGYRRACAALLTPIATGPVRADIAIEAVWTICLAPDAVDDYARPIELASNASAALDKEIDTSAEFRELRHGARRTHAAILLRAGRLAEAQAKLATTAAGDDSDPLTDLLLVIAHARTGQISEAEARLAKALKALAALAGRPVPWQVKAELDLLSAEARGTIH